MASKVRKERRRLEQQQRQLEHLKAILGELESMPERHDEATLVEVVKPQLVERMQRETEQFGQTYEEANWAKLSPTFRAAHNKLLQAKGLPTIPPPAVDLYRPPLVKRADPVELARLTAEQNTAKAQFLGQQRHMAPGREGFTINGEEVKW